MGQSYEELTKQVMEEAFTPLGTSRAAAIVCCVIYFLFMCVAIFSYVATKYAWYDVLIICTAFRTVAMGARAAYLYHYHPAYSGIFLAFSNAGFAATGAVLLLTCGAWMKHKGVQIFSPGGEKTARMTCYIMCIPIIAFGPILGVIAAGLIFGDFKSTNAALHGDRCRSAATYGFVALFVFILCWVTLLTVRILTVGKSRRHAGATSDSGKPTPAQSSKNPYLIAVFIPVTALLLIRGCTGAVALYKDYEFVWAKDVWFYCLDTLPEFMTLVILCWPKFLARISCSWEPDGSQRAEQGDTAIDKANP